MCKSLLYRKPYYKIISFYNKAFQGTLVNLSLLSLHKGSLKITLKVHLKTDFKKKWALEMTEF